MNQEFEETFREQWKTLAKLGGHFFLGAVLFVVLAIPAILTDFIAQYLNELEKPLSFGGNILQLSEPVSLGLHWMHHLMLFADIIYSGKFIFSPLFSDLRSMLQDFNHPRATSHLPQNLRLVVKGWIEDSYRDKQLSFTGDEGMDVDQCLVDNAKRSIHASTYVTAASMSFWKEPNIGERYRIACSTLANRNKHVARIFSLNSSDESNLVKAVLEEADKQETEGIKVRILVQSDIYNQAVAQHDVLIVDKLISSTTVSYTPGGIARDVNVSWNTDNVDKLMKEWTSLWKKTLSVSEFREKFKKI